MTMLYPDMRAKVPDLDSLYSRLLGFVNVERGQRTELKLDRMRSLCACLGHPEAACPVLHIAGSKGKGSVSIMAARILEAAGFRVGLYTSPHFLSWKERISLAGNEMPDRVILDAAEEVFSVVEADGSDSEGEPTYFELTTLIAFCAFRLADCDRMVLETGLGGRLDSTNVVDPQASVITRIELEHTEYLGDSVEAIAAEKAGIIKPRRPCFIGEQRAEARATIAAAAAERGSPLRDATSLVSVSEIEITRHGTSASLSFAADPLLAPRFPSPLRLRTPLVGRVQADNMALALLSVAETEREIDAQAAVRGLDRAYLSARFQILPLDPPVVLDGAHTPESADLALKTFEYLFPGPKALLFACASDKRHWEIATILAPAFDRITITRPGSFKASDLEAVNASFREKGAEPRSIADYREAIKSARSESAAAGMSLLVTGSFYLCAEAYSMLIES